MMSSRPDCHLTCPTQGELDAFRRAGVAALALATPWAMKVASGNIGSDGRFDADPNGERWFSFEELDVGDVVFWQPSSDRIASWCGRAFALGEAIIDEPSTYGFDCSLNIFADPMDWLRADRDGIVILPNQWPLAFDRLRDCPRVALAEKLLPAYRANMRPARLPELMVIPERRHAA